MLNLILLVKTCLPTGKIRAIRGRNMSNQLCQFMQNKPNLLNAQMNITSVNTMNYELRTMNYFMQNKPNTKPIKPNFSPKQTQSNPTCSELACPELVEGVEPISNATLQKWVITSEHS